MDGNVSLSDGKFTNLVQTYAFLYSFLTDIHVTERTKSAYFDDCSFFSSDDVKMLKESPLTLT